MQDFLQCVHWQPKQTIWKAEDSGRKTSEWLHKIQWRIHYFPDEGRQPPTYYLAIFFQKLHESQRNWTQGAYIHAAPLDPPVQMQGFQKFRL